MPMNDRKRAWQMLHNEIRRRAAVLDGTADTCDPSWVSNQFAIMREVESESTLIFELAGFGATYALLPKPIPDPVGFADAYGATVMAEPDDPDHDEVEKELT